jgi:hypothetical protein
MLTDIATLLMRAACQLDDASLAGQLFRLAAGREPQLLAVLRSDEQKACWHCT